MDFGDSVPLTASGRSCSRVPVGGLWADSAWVVHLSLTPDIEVTGDGDPHAGEEGVEKTYYGWHAVTATI